jgi:hypothetical protein
MSNMVRISAGLLAVLILILPEPCRGGISVNIRADENTDAPITETIELYGSSYALIIGNDEYSAGWPKLSNAISDAREIAAELEKRGFQVMFRENLDSMALQQSLKEFFAIQGANPDARLLLWYAGHGHTIKGEGFLVPVDAPKPNDRAFKVKALHMRDFGGLMRLAESKHVFAVFDSCFSGTIFQTRAGVAPPAITRATVEPVRQFLTSGDVNQEVSDDGVFRKLFLRALRGEGAADANGDGYVTGTEIGLFLGSEVSNVTENAQTPRYGKLRDPDFNLGDIVFALPERKSGATTAAGTEPASTSDPSAPVGEDPMVEITFWASVAGSSDPDQVQTYLDKYPKGHFAPVARLRIEALISAPQDLAETSGGAPPAATADSGPSPTVDQKKPEETQTAALVEKAPTQGSLPETSTGGKTETAPDRPAISPINEYWWAKKTANVRAGPTTKTGKVGLIRKGSRVAVKGKVVDQPWYEIRLEDGTVGYVFAKLIDKTSPAAAGSPGSASSSEASRLAAISPAAGRALSAPARALLRACEEAGGEFYQQDCAQVADRFARTGNPATGLPVIDKLEGGDVVIRGPWNGQVVLRKKFDTCSQLTAPGKPKAMVSAEKMTFSSAVKGLFGKLFGN